MIHKAYNLQDRHTMACSSWAEYASIICSRSDLVASWRWANEADAPIHVLGEGSNVLVAEHVPGLTLLNRLQGVRVHSESTHEVVVDVASGVSWHWWVCFSSAQGWHGLENLALIPGTVGAAPVQNIGAYGVEVAECMEHLDAMDLRTGAEQRFAREDCDFGYRQSIFKGRQSGRWFILRVRFRLSKQFNPVLSYRPLDGLNSPTPQELIDEVVRVRRSKLPDPALIPNSGSFFTNPVVSSDQAQALLAVWPELPVFVQPDGQVKLAAGWMIERAGLRGVSDPETGVGTHDRQALVLINPCKRPRDEVMARARVIQQAVWKTFNVMLQPEPQLFG